jgi:regulator of sigma E protease
MSVIEAILAFLFAIGPLIIFHELGHYLLARLCGVKVLRFSVGMGKVVWSRRFGRDQTEWAVSALPLGGYVKMLDNRDPETAAKTVDEAAFEFTRKSVWKRIAIVAAGPVFNFILAIVLLAGLYTYGVPDDSTRVRRMADTTLAHTAGLRADDRIVAANGKPVAGWSDLRWELMQAAMDKRELVLSVVQPEGMPFTATFPAPALAALKLEGDFMSPLGLVPELKPAQLGPLTDGPARRAGLQEGDIIVRIDAKPARDHLDVIDMVRASGGRVMTFEVLRGGTTLDLAVTPEVDPKTGQAMIKAALVSGPVKVTVAVDPLTAVAKAARKTWDTSALTLKMIGNMIVGKASLKNITGPGTIAEYAGKTARAGPIEYLSFIAFISISLGVMNLLPIPVLDGGHLLYYSLEVLTGRPLPERFVEFAQRAGVVMLVMLMSLAIFNDAVRLL